MTILDRYLSTRLIATLAKTIVAFILTYILIDVLATRRVEILKHDVPFDAVLSYYASLIPQIIYRVSGIAFLVSTLLVFGDAAQRNEVVAALAGGISLRRLSRMPIAIALAFSVGLFIFQESAGTWAASESGHLAKTYFSASRDAQRSGVSWANLNGNWTSHIMKFNRIALTGENVLMHAVREDGLEQIQARRIYWDDIGKQWMLEDGRWRFFSSDSTYETRETLRISRLPAPIKETPKQLFVLAEPPETKSPGRLARDIRQAELRGMPVSGLWVDYYAKFAQPLVSFVMIWLAIPFALRIRRGGLGISFGISIAIALTYLILFLIGITLGHVGRMPALASAWLANAVFLAVGLVLFHRTPT